MVLRKYKEKLKRVVATPYQNVTSFKKEEKHDLAVVRYPSLSIDLLYNFKKVQPMPNHPTIFFFSAYSKKEPTFPPSQSLLYPTSRLFMTNNARDVIIKSQLLREKFFSNYIFLLAIFLSYELKCRHKNI